MFEYKFTQTENSEGNLYNAILEAKFRFKDDLQNIPPKKHKDVKNRMEYTWSGGKEFLNFYLRKVEKLLQINTSNNFEGKYPDEKRKMQIKKRPWKKGLDVIVYFSDQFPSKNSKKPKDLLDMEGLNNFILTGKYPFEDFDEVDNSIYLPKYPPTKNSGNF